MELAKRFWAQGRAEEAEVALEEAGQFFTTSKNAFGLTSCQEIKSQWMPPRIAKQGWFIWSTASRPVVKSDALVRPEVRYVIRGSQRTVQIFLGGIELGIFQKDRPYDQVYVFGQVDSDLKPLRLKAMAVSTLATVPPRMRT